MHEQRKKEGRKEGMKGMKEKEGKEEKEGDK